MAERKEKVLKFIWKVENFSYWNEADDFLESPEFYLDGNAWCLNLYPKGRSSDESYVSVYLQRLSRSGGPLGITIDYKIALLEQNGAIECVKEMKDRCFKKGNEHGFDNLVDQEELFGEKKSTLLPKDVLTLQCCISPKNTELETYTEILARTHIGIERYRRQWKNIDYTINNPIPLNGAEDLRGMFFQLSVSREYDDQNDVLTGHFCHLILSTTITMHCKIGVLDSDNSVVKLLVNDFFDIETQSDYFLNFPLITIPELLENQSLYLPRGKLNLDCEFTVCNGVQQSEIEGIAQEAAFMPVPLEETASTSQTDVPSKKFLYCIDNALSSLKNDFKSLYHEGILCDFTIKVGNKSFKAHKAVLCARSPVFKALLTGDMKENERNMMDISDLEEDTVYRMLTFMYMDMVGNLEWDTANKLYFAADKYGLITLRRICSDVLYQYLSATNVREVLTLANMHADEYLMKITVKFICNNETEVMRSSEWETFMTEDLNLAAETMRQILLEKADNRQ